MALGHREVEVKLTVLAEKLPRLDQQGLEAKRPGTTQGFDHVSLRTMSYGSNSPNVTAWDIFSTSNECFTTLMSVASYTIS
jgi:hypothetical protein